MVTFQHPASLNALERYQQARSMLRHSTRAANPAWYQAALDLDLQLHIRVDGPSVASCFFERRKEQWTKGPVITEAELRDAANMETCAAEILRQARLFNASALGVIIHLADEFATSELKPALDNPAALPDLREAAVQKPATILDDSSIPPDQNSWRVLPYPAQGSGVIGTTITLTRKYAPFLTTLRQTGEAHNFPIITHALSAPLVAVMGLAQYAPLVPGKAAVAILQYPWFSVLAFFNEHADLLLIRTLQHRHLRQAPNLRHALTTTYASLELIDPDLFILSLGLDLDSGLHRDLCQAFPLSRVSIVAVPTPDGVPTCCPEPVIAATAPPKGEAARSLTFDILRDEKWALQDFLSTPKEISEVYPTRAEMQLLRGLRLARFGLCVLGVLILAWFALGIVDIVRSAAWTFVPSQVEVIKGRLNNLTTERQKSLHWDNLLEDRSKAWTSMELLSHLFPERCGILVKSFAHSVRADSAPGQAKIGFVKEWKITGLARDEALDRLNTLNTQEGITSQFHELARATGNPAFNPAVRTRSLAVNIRTQENNTFKSLPVEETFDTDESSYPFNFDLTITQRFEGTDPMAINVSKVN
ncbi:MAG: hypothetical protein DVB25_03995 [Verrucomicrobia bacterium]|nr:MAG: hypothetical protein DVB25_03995 [Verrucomicrobiota bacterium]